MAHFDRKLEMDELKKFVVSLNDECKEGSLVVVEGINDQKALRLIGFNGDIVVLNNFRGITKLVDNITNKNKKIILLLDMDRKGKILTSKILSQINSICRHDHLHAKNRLARITGGRIRHIEDLSTFSMAIS
ncbi:MAG TPA: toprim domain-containing protein [Nitrososphaeraceae archaeon]|jgi:5S rRNA maturation endonuclease (ribonuclease M5)